jgi:hypothetical protein
VDNLKSDKCFWLYSESDEAKNDGSCKSKTDTSIQCGDAKRSGQCTLADVDELGGNCVWVTPTSSGVSECKTVVTACDADGIKSDKGWCETENAVVSAGGAEVSCFWVENSELQGGGSCVQVVCCEGREGKGREGKRKEGKGEGRKGEEGGGKGN